MNLNFKKSLFIFIIALASFFRLWQLDSIPPSASLDEASIGYNAYSVLKTGGDEYGKFPFLSQRAYDDWRRSTYLFLTIPFIATLDLQVLAVRLPAAILSILTVMASYFIVRNLFSKTKYVELMATLVMLLLALSPWHIYISRLGHESNASFSFFMFGVLFFLWGLKNNMKLFISLVFFALSMMSYYSGQGFIPLFLIGTLLIYEKTIISIIMSSRKNLFIFASYIALTIILLVILYSGESLTRFHGTSALTPEAYPKEFAKMVQMHNEAQQKHDYLRLLLNNRYIFFGQIYTNNYLSHFNPKWLFINTGNEPFKIPNMGLLNIWTSPFLLIGIFAFVFSKIFDKRTKLFVLLWFFLGPFSASVATQAPHAMRSLNFLPSWQIFTATGIIYLIFKFKKFEKVIIIVVVFLIVFKIGSLYKNYFVLFPKEQSAPYQYALHQAIKYVASNQNKYSSIVISNKDNLYQSYMFYLYDTKYDPALYQKQGGTISGGYAETHHIGKYEFRPIDKLTKKGKTLYVGNVDELQNKGKLLMQFKSLGGHTDILAVETNE